MNKHLRVQPPRAWRSTLACIALYLAAIIAPTALGASYYECSALLDFSSENDPLILTIPEVNADGPTPAKVILRDREIEAMYGIMGLNEVWAIDIDKEEQDMALIMLKPDLMAGYWWSVQDGGKAREGPPDSTFMCTFVRDD